MLILTEWNKSYIIESTNGPIVPKYYWMFSGHMLDFTLTPLVYLEETTGPVYTIEINRFKFDVPAKWNILIVDNDTYQIDTVPISTCATNVTYAFAMSPTDNGVKTVKVDILEYKEEAVLIHPLVQKGSGFCHPVGYLNNNDQEFSVVLSPYDLYKYIGDKVVGDILP